MGMRNSISSTLPVRIPPNVHCGLQHDQPSVRHMAPAPPIPDIVDRCEKRSPVRESRPAKVEPQKCDQPATARSGAALASADSTASMMLSKGVEVAIDEGVGSTAFTIEPGGPRSMSTQRYTPPLCGVSWGNTVRRPA